MRERITVRIPSELEKALTRFAKRRGVSRNAVVLKALECYVFHKELERFHRIVAPYLRRKGILSEEDILRLCERV